MHGKSSSRTNNWKCIWSKGVEACYEAEVTEQSEVIYDKHEVEGETQPKQVPVENGENEKMSEIESVVNNNERYGVEHDNR